MSAGVYFGAAPQLGDQAAATAETPTRRRSRPPCGSALATLAGVVGFAAGDSVLASAFGVGSHAGLVAGVGSASNIRGAYTPATPSAMARRTSSAVSGGELSGVSSFEVETSLV